MRLIYKQLFRELFKNKIYTALLLVLTFSTSFMYFFVHFSVDGNMRILNALASLSEDQLLYRNGLNSNTILAGNVLLVFTCMTGFVFSMFYYRFFKLGKKQIGCVKALGYKDREIRGIFLVYTAGITTIGGFTGIGGGYFASDILINASEKTYLQTGLIKALDIKSILVGLLFPLGVFLFLTFCNYFYIRRKESGLLLSGVAQESRYTMGLRIANKIVAVVPTKNRSALRLALRKPVAIILIIISVMCFSVMFILGYSLNLSSQKIFDSQMKGYHYLYDTHFHEPVPFTAIERESLPYLSADGVIEKGGEKVNQKVYGIEDGKELFELVDLEGKPLLIPGENEIVIGAALNDLYGFQEGDRIVMSLNHKDYELVISGIAYNAALNSIYISKQELAQRLSLPSDYCNGVWSMKDLDLGGEVTTKAQRIDKLERDAVSNKSSAVINEVLGCVVGCILLFLALYMNFQDSTRDILILHLMGYKVKEIRKMLINIYGPMMRLFFFLTLIPGILLVRSILRILSLQIGDYIPFQTDGFILAGIFVMLNLVYMLVQGSFQAGIKRIIRNDDVASYTSS
ncbi:FtsX-like permease family protein [uncultured Robinsoniella sp.]|uniref:FtsX-like permease family protein n=1 Tax=uncultured Robinsoniella sp. TaxID=904190 RepID=UPI00374E2DBF